MLEQFKKRNVVITASIVILLIIFGAIFFFTSNKKSQNQNTQNSNAIPTEVTVLSMNPEDIGLTLAVAPDMETATMTISKTNDISSVDYQFIYYAMVSGQSIERGTDGSMVVKTPGQVISQQMTFGTCSDVCHYDTGITNIQLIVKITKIDGKVYQVEISPTPSTTQ